MLSLKWNVILLHFILGHKRTCWSVSGCLKTDLIKSACIGFFPPLPKWKEITWKPHFFYVDTWVFFLIIYFHYIFLGHDAITQGHYKNSHSHSS